jgi:hypothetical protein
MSHHSYSSNIILSNVNAIKKIKINWSLYYLKTLLKLPDSSEKGRRKKLKIVYSEMSGRCSAYKTIQSMGMVCGERMYGLCGCRLSLKLYILFMRQMKIIGKYQIIDQLIWK